MNRRSKAFSLIELLIVIGVIALLLGILVWGLRGFGNQATAKDTRNRMETLKSMLGSLKSANNLKDIDAMYGPSPLFPAPMPSPGDVKTGNDFRYPKSLTKPVHQSVVSTWRVMSLLRAVPTNRATLENLPSNYFLEPEPIDKVPFNPPMILDGWNDPILFVPAAGLTGLTNKGVSIPTRTSPNGQPFFASAGPDGNFNTDEDNVYSFEN